MSISRRNMLTSAGAVAATAVSSVSFAQEFVPGARQPDSHVKALDPSFNKYMVFFAMVQQLYYSPKTAYTEGPVYFGDGRYLL